MSFSNLNLHAKILRAVEEAGYSTPSPIQEKAIPKVVKGLDVRASAQTGTGKTAAFLLPALNRLVEEPGSKGKGPRILILAPTRELAMQVSTQAVKYSRYLRRAKSVCIYGGVPYHAQMRQLSKPYEILIATPGRLIDHMKRGKISLSRVELLVLDEADRMLDMGFIEPVEEIVAATPPERQTVLFSATLEGQVMQLSERLMNNPMEIKVQAEQRSNAKISQSLYYADDLGHKHRLLENLLSQPEIESAIVFTSTKRHADELVDELFDKGYRAAALHGDMNQRQRSRTVQQLRDGKVKIVVATDVAARGIDVPSISHVINFDLPHNTEDYVHRIGRTGRAGAEGKALSLIGSRDRQLVERIEKYTGVKIEVCEIPGLEPRKREERRPQQKRKRPFKGNFKARKPFAKGRGRPFRKKGAPAKMSG